MAKINTLNYQTVAAWNGSQDLFVVEQTDGTKVATPEQVKQYVLGNSIDDIYSVMGQMGAKNLNIFPYKNGGAGDTWETNGITYTVNADGTLEADGTATADAYFRCGISTDDSNPIYLEEGKSYILSGSGSNDIDILLRDSTNTNIAYASATDTVYNCTTSGKFYVLIRVKNGKTVNHHAIKPMLRLASDTDNTYQPYAKTNRQLTEAIGDLSQTGLTGDSVADQLTNAGDKFKRLNNIKIIDEDFVIFFVGYSDVASRVLCPINFPFAFSGTDYTLTCSKIELVNIGNFTTGIAVDTKFRSSALIILSRASAAGASCVGRAHIHISRTE